MKQRYTIEIANVQLNILSDEKEDFVKEIVARIDKEVRNITVQNKRCSTTDAALLCALDYYAERLKAEKRIKNLEAQLALYDTNLRRLKNENNALQATINEKPAPAKNIAVADSESKEAPAASQEKKEASAEGEQSMSGKLRQLEMMLQDMKK